MQRNNDRHIERLLERFFEGETSNTEERELYRFFARGDLPEYWKSYRPLFNYFETGLAGEKTKRKQMKPVLKPLPTGYYLIAAILIAASFLVILVLNYRGGMEPDDFNPYAGSYRIRNGVRTEISGKIARRLCEEQIANDKSRYFLDLMEKQREVEKKMEQREQEINQMEKEFTNKLEQTE